MIIELVGSRIISPYVGTSIYVWTSLIGIILGSLSLGYYLGGRSADKNPNLKTLSLILLLSGISTVAIIYLRYIAYRLGIFNSEFNLLSIIFAPFIFVPSTLFFGMVTPYIIRLHLKNIETSGAAVGKLYALSTIGSIIGTFLGGFLLISYFGSTNILIILGIITICLSLIVYLFHKKDLGFPLVVCLAIGLSLLTFRTPTAIPTPGNLVADIDTPYKRLWIFDSTDYVTKLPTRIITDTVFGSQSGIFLDNPSELLFEYQKYFDLVSHFSPSGKKLLMIGAGAFTYPAHYLANNSTGTIDVVEIDPSMEEISTKYFSLVKDPRLKIIHDDGRIFLNKTSEVYDGIFVDAFTSLLSIPYQLTTKETVDKLYEKVSLDGAVIVNIISAIEGGKGEFLRAEYVTYKTVFPTVLLFKVYEHINDKTVQNIILVATKKPAPTLQSRDTELNRLLKNIYTKKIKEDMPILYDDFAPVEKYTAKLIL